MGFGHSGQQSSFQKTENKTDFPFILLKLASSAVGSHGSFLFAAHTRKNVLFAHSTSPRCESSLPSLRAVGGLCLEVSLGTQGPDPVLCQLCAIQNRSCFRSENNHPEMGQAPTSQASPRDTDHLRPSNSAAKILSVVENSLSKFDGDPCPMRRGLVAAVK